MMQSRNRYEQNSTATPHSGYGQPAPAWRLTRRGKMVVFLSLAAVDAILAIVLLGMLFRLW